MAVNGAERWQSGYVGTGLSAFGDDGVISLRKDGEDYAVVLLDSFTTEGEIKEVLEELSNPGAEAAANAFVRHVAQQGNQSS